MGIQISVASNQWSKNCITFFAIFCLLDEKTFFLKITSHFDDVPFVVFVGVVGPWELESVLTADDLGIGLGVESGFGFF